MKLRAILLFSLCGLLFPTVVKSQYCSGVTTLTAASGSFSDGSGTNNYTDNSNCQWLIQPSGASSITLSFTSFETEASFDFVEIYDGTTTAATLLGSFSGTLLPSPVTSTGGAILVVFTTDASFNYSGWSANYTSIITQVAPVANPATGILTSSFTANWSSSAFATGYQLDVATDAGFTSFVSGYNNKDVFNVTSFNVTGLSANNYYYRVRAYNFSQTSINSNTRITALGTTCTSLNYKASKAVSIKGSYSDLGTNGSVITTSNFDDAISAAQNIGFTFNYNCQSFNQFILTTNGFIKLGSTPPSSVGLYFNGGQTAVGGIFNSTDPADNNIISPFNHDLDAGTGIPEYRLYTSGLAPNRICTIQYKNVREYALETPSQQYDNMQFQIRLYETSNIIEFVYGDWTPSVNTSAFKTSACGLKGSGFADNQLLAVSKGSVTTWDAVSFNNANYWTTATLNFGNPPDRPKPDSARTFRFVPTYNNDLTVGEIYAMGDASLYYSTPQSIAVNIINSGFNNLTNIPVTLTVSGANNFTSTKNISSLNSGANAVITFDDFTPLVNGSTLITVSLPSDDNTGDNTKTWTQNTNNYICNNSSTANPPFSWGGVNDSIWYVKYHVTGSANVNSVKVYIANDAASVGQTVFGAVLNTTGALVAKSSNYLILAGDLNTWHTFTFAIPPTITDGYFYAGFGNILGASNYFALGSQKESPSRVNTYYQSAIDGSNLRLTYPGGRFMIGATLAPLAPVAGTASIVAANCIGSPAFLSLSGYIGSIHWQQSANGTTGWAYVTTGTGITSPNFTSANLTSAIYYRAEISQPGYTTLYSNVLAITPLTPPTAPVPGTITQTTCLVTTGSVALSGLPATGTWTLTFTPGPISMTGTGTTFTATGLTPGTYTCTVINASGCTSPATANIVVNATPSLPSTPNIGTITQPTCSLATGSVILNGLPSSGTWSLTKSPGGTTTSGTGTTSTLTGLSAGTYTYTITNSSGCTSVASSNIVINTQPAIPSTPTANTETNLIQTSYTANWTSSATATGYRLDVATNSSFTTFVTTYSDKDVGAVTSFSVTGLTANTTYYYRVRAYSTCGASSSSGTITSTTLPNPPTAPVANSSTNVSQLSFIANWGSSSSATGYRLDVASDAAFTSLIIGFADKDVSNVLTYNITGLSANTTYYYRLRAYNTGGTSASSNSIQIVTLPNPPAAPVATQASSVSQTSFIANWNSAVTSTGYLLDVSTNIGFTSLVSGYNAKDVNNVTSYNVSGLSPKTPYYYRVKSYNSGGSGGTSGVINVTTLSNPPASPSGLTIFSCNNLVTLKWRKNTDPYFLRYRIYSGTTTNPTVRTDSSSNNIVDTTKIISGLLKGQTYFFRLTAVNSDGPESALSSQVSDVVKSGVIPKIKAKWGEILICYNVGDSIVSYQWFNGNTAVSGEVKQYYDNKKASGIYRVETVDKNGCKNPSNTISSSGTKSLSVYPNPASVSFAIKLNDDTEGIAIVSILNSEGAKVMELKVDNVSNELLKQIPVNNLPEGIYVVQVLLNHKDLYYGKIVVIK